MQLLCNLIVNLMQLLCISIVILMHVINLMQIMHFNAVIELLKGITIAKNEMRKHWNICFIHAFIFLWKKEKCALQHEKKNTHN